MVGRRLEAALCMTTYEYVHINHVKNSRGKLDAREKKALTSPYVLMFCLNLGRGRIA